MSADVSHSQVEIVIVPEQALICLRGRGHIRELAPRIERLRALVAEAGLEPAGHPLARFYDEIFDPGDVDFDVCLPVTPAADGSIPDTVAEARTHLVPSHPAVAVTASGPHPTLDSAHAALTDELERLGYTPAGPATEVFLVGPGDGVTPDAYVTEVRRPYAR